MERLQRAPGPDRGRIPAPAPPVFSACLTRSRPRHPGAGPRRGRPQGVLRAGGVSPSDPFPAPFSPPHSRLNFPFDPHGPAGPRARAVLLGSGPTGPTPLLAPPGGYDTKDGNGGERGATPFKERSRPLIRSCRLNVADIARSVDWYKDKLGAEVLYQDATWAFLQAGGVKLRSPSATSTPPTSRSTSARTRPKTSSRPPGSTATGPCPATSPTPTATPSSGSITQSRKAEPDAPKWCVRQEC